VQKHYDPEMLQSSYKTTFTKPNVNSNASSNDQAILNQYYQNKPKNVPFYSETEYNKSYQKTNVLPVLFRLKLSLSPPMYISPKLPNLRGNPITRQSLFIKATTTSKIMFRKPA
jgi:hypothetical protein